MKMDRYKVYKWDQANRKWIYSGKIAVKEGQKMQNTFTESYQKIDPPNWDRIISWLALAVAIAALFT